MAVHLVAHTADGWVVIKRPRKSLEMTGGDVAWEWITYEKRGHLRVLTHYEPN